MFINYRYKWLLLISSLLLVGCSREAKEVTFVVNKGDEARYWVNSQTLIELDGHKEGVSNRSLTHYRIEEVKDNLQLYMNMEHLELYFAGANIHSIESSSTKNKELKQIFSEGFDITLDQQTGEVLDIQGRNSELWQELLKQGGQIFMDAMMKSMASPGVITSIPAKPGAVIALPHFHGQSVQLTVESVSDEHLVVIIESTSEVVDPASETVTKPSPQAAHLYAQIRLNRHNGWVDKMALIVKAPLDIQGRQATVTTVVAMTPEDKPLGDISVFNDDIYYYDDWIDLSEMPDDWRLQPPEGAVLSDDIFMYGKGIVNDPHDYQYKLGLLHNIDDPEWFGYMDYRNIQALNSNDQDLEVDFFTHSGAYLREHEHFQSSEATIVPMGWDKQKELGQLHTIRATVDYFDDEITSHSVDWQELQKKEIDLGAVKLKVTPKLGKTNEYIINYRNGKDKWLMSYSIGGIKGQFKLRQPMVGPEWLTKPQRDFFARLRVMEEVPWSVDLKLTEEPSEVTFFVANQTQEPKFSRQIEFVSDKAFMAEPNIPPLVEQIWNQIDSQTEFLLESLQPEIVKGQGAKLTLPKEWNDVCQLYVENKVSINDTPLVWRPSWQSFDYDPSVTKSENRYLPVENRLMTKDGVQFYFYDIDVESRIECDAQPQWQELDYQPYQSDQPWLISIKALDIQPDDSVELLLDNYRFYNQQGDAVVLLDKKGNTVMDPQGSVSQLLHDEQFIKAAGRVLQIKKLQLIDKKQQKSWKHHFSALPE